MSRSTSDPAVATATGTDGISNIQNVTGGMGDNTLIGNAQNNILIGGPANNMFTGGGGTDTITGNTTGTNTLVETQDASKIDTTTGQVWKSLTANPSSAMMSANVDR